MKIRYFGTDYEVIDVSRKEQETTVVAMHPDGTVVNIPGDIPIREIVLDDESQEIIILARQEDDYL